MKLPRPQHYSFAGIVQAINLAFDIIERTPSGGSSPLTTKGDVYTHDATVDARLPVGTNTHVLTADSAQALGIKWAVAPGGSPLTTKGDLFGFDVANTRIPVGADGLALVASSAQPTGLVYASPAPAPHHNSHEPNGSDHLVIATGSYDPSADMTIPDGQYAIFADHFTLTGTESLTVQGTGVLRGI